MYYDGGRFLIRVVRPNDMGQKKSDRKNILYFFGDKQISGENADDAIWVIMVIVIVARVV